MGQNVSACPQANSKPILTRHSSSDEDRAWIAAYRQIYDDRKYNAAL